MKSYDVAIIGGGFSGTLVAIQLARKADRSIRIILIDRGGSAGRGVAYGTTDPKHLLNVRAERMGAFPDDAEHFYRWLQGHREKLEMLGIRELTPTSFIPRCLYGDYLQELLQEAQEKQKGIEVRRAEIVDLIPQTAGGYELLSADGAMLSAQFVVLALGNFPPGICDPEQKEPWHLSNPYALEIQRLLAEPGDVLIVGTGLTSLDLLSTLRATKAEGTIHLLSSHGLFPQPHRIVPPYPPFLDPDHLPTTARTLFQRVRKEIAAAAERGIDWRSVIDTLRPTIQKLWQALNLIEQRRFLRHVRPFWEIHRHRCPPAILAMKESMEAAGRLVCHRGRILQYQPTDNGVAVTYLETKTRSEKTIPVRFVLSCTGPQPDYRKLHDRLIKQLLARDLLAPDPLFLGAHTNEKGQVLNHQGAPTPNLYTLGSPQRGRLYESTAVAELRSQAAELASHLLEKMSSCGKITPP